MKCKYCTQEAVSYCDVTLGGIGWFLYHCAAHEQDAIAEQNTILEKRKRDFAEMKEWDENYREVGREIEP